MLDIKSIYTVSYVNYISTNLGELFLINFKTKV